MPTLDFKVQKKGTQVKVTDNDLVGTGGEGSVYVKGNMAYKIYTDPAKMIPMGKIQELSALTAPYIFKPEDVLLDMKNTPIGFSMRAVPDSMPLCQLFPPKARQRMNITPDMTLAQVRKLQEGIGFVHGKGSLIVDLNELNFLVDKNLSDIYFIDVTTYKTPSFPPTAIMPNIEDYLANRQFTELTDWFSFAVIATMMFIGIHPYKGTHPNYGPKDLIPRMKANASIFDTNVSLPPVVLPWTVVPPIYQQWLKAVLQDKKRCPPPDDLTGTIILTHTIQRLVQQGTKFTIEEVWNLAEEVLSYREGVVVSTKGVYQGKRRLCDAPRNTRVGIAPQTQSVIRAHREASQIKFHNATLNTPIPNTIVGDDLMETDGRLYVKQEEKILEITFTELPKSILIGTKHVGNVLPNATLLFEGGAIQDIFGAHYLSLFPKSGICHQVKVKELDGYRVIEAKYSRNVLMVVANKGGKYDKFVMRFNTAFNSYDLRLVEDISYQGLNFAVLDNGVCVHINEQDEIELFRTQKDAGSVTVVADPAIGGDVLLCSFGAQAMFAKGDKLYKFTMKKP